MQTKNRSGVPYWHTLMHSPVAELKLVCDDEHLLAVLWHPDRPKRVMLPSSIEKDSHPILVDARMQLEEYFAKLRLVFDLPIRFAGTQFQNQVWSALQEIENGETWSYQQLARRIQRPSASRAVGAAVGRNPLSIIVPCHRVIGANGRLTGFAGGLDAKTSLLALEGRIAAAL